MKYKKNFFCLRYIVCLLWRDTIWDYSVFFNLRLPLFFFFFLLLYCRLCLLKEKLYDYFVKSEIFFFLFQLMSFSSYG